MLRNVFRKCKLLQNFYYDYGRFVRHSSAVNCGDTPQKLETLIMMRIHAIEKGLSLSEPRLGFGQKVLSDLFEMMEKYAECGTDGFVNKMGIEVIREYIRFHKHRGFDVNTIEQRVEALSKVLSQSNGLSHVEAGVEMIRKQDMYADALIDFEAFCSSRYSVRQFSDKAVPQEILWDAVKVAQKTPSVCNRQSSKVWVITEKNKLQKALDIGGGAVGFNSVIQSVLIVTSDLARFISAGERYQCWVDGGMFAMSLIYALHAKGLVSCCMNWSKECRTDKQMRSFLNMPECENILLLIGVGYPLETFAVARSVRKPTRDCVVFL